MSDSNKAKIPPPEEFIKQNIGRVVIVKLQSEEQYKGNYSLYYFYRSVDIA